MPSSQHPYTGVGLDSRQIQPGWLYAALPGSRTHGARFAAQAVAAGAVAILTDADGAELAGDPGVPVIVVADPRVELAQVAAAVHGHPSRRLAMLGVTGTAGKTSTVALLAAALTAAGESAGTIGSLGFSLGGAPFEARTTTPTTPESPDLQAVLAAMARAGASCVAMEVTSHSLALHRVDGIEFEVSGFTNLGHDHLDFHPDQEHYYQTKAMLFQDGRTGCAVVEVDHSWGQRLARDLAARGQSVVTTSLADDADYRARRWFSTPDGRTSAQFATPSGLVDVEIGMMGEFSVRNALMAVAMIDQSRFDLGAALPGFAKAVVPGRMQQIRLGEGAPNVIVDNAHVAEEVAAALAGLPGPRRIVLLSCGGDRDKSKRAPMGEAAARGADVVIVADDNSRTEDPASIRAAVLAGAEAVAAETGAEVIDCGDRRSAITLALRMASPGDWVAILGKGAETELLIGDQRIPFSDAVVVREQWQIIRGEAQELQA